MSNNSHGLIRPINKQPDSAHNNIQPLIIMVCIPFGIIGAVAGHIIMGYAMSLLSLSGFGRIKR